MNVKFSFEFRPLRMISPGVSLTYRDALLRVEISTRAAALLFMRNQSGTDVVFQLDNVWAEESGLLQPVFVGQVEIPGRYTPYLHRPDSYSACVVRITCLVTGQSRVFYPPSRYESFSLMCSADSPAEFEVLQNGDWEQVPSPIEWYEG